MKPRTRKKITRAMRRYLEKLLKNLLTDPGISAAMRMRGGVDADVSMQRALPSGIKFALSEADSVLRKRPEPTPQQMQRFLKEMEQTEVDPLVRSFLATVLRRLPPFPPGKRPSLTPQQQKEALVEVRRLTSTANLPRKTAYEKVAKAYAVHWRTIQNLWMKNLHKQNPEGERE